MDTYHWDVLVRYHWDVIWCFIWDLFETSWRRTDGAPSLRPHETSSRHTNKTSWTRTTETVLDVSFETYMQRHWDIQRDVIMTSPRRLVAGWEILFLKVLMNLSASTGFPSLYVEYISISLSSKHFLKDLL